MPNCEMCGKDAPLFKALIEGSELKVCKDCAGHGKILQRPVFVSKEKKKKEEQKEEEKEILEILAEDYSKKVKAAREKLGLTQEELAKKLNEKESVLQKIETASFRPGIELAKKLEGFLHIKIVEQTEVEKIKMKKSDSDSFTLGDFIKKKK
jgi:putative transcription factor